MLSAVVLFHDFFPTTCTRLVVDFACCRNLKTNPSHNTDKARRQRAALEASLIGQRETPGDCVCYSVCVRRLRQVASQDVNNAPNTRSMLTETTNSRD